MPKLKLLATHTHAGVAYPKGHILQVDTYTAGWLIERHIAQVIPQTVPQAAPARAQPTVQVAAQSTPLSPTPSPSSSDVSQTPTTQPKE